jgi:ADP-ribosylation factor 2-binding protein
MQIMMVKIIFDFFFRERKDELDGEIFEMLLTFSDFMTFKEMFLDFKAVSITH